MGSVLGVCAGGGACGEGPSDPYGGRDPDDLSGAARNLAGKEEGSLTRSDPEP